VPELARRLGLNLADVLAGEARLLTDFFLRTAGVHADAEARAEQALFA
jgi:hypothetical protein